MLHFISDIVEARRAMEANLFCDGIFVPEHDASAFAVPAPWTWMSDGHERDGRRWALFKPRDPFAKALDILV